MCVIIRGECGCATASLWLRHAPSCDLAIGSRQMHAAHLCQLHLSTPWGLNVCHYTAKSGRGADEITPLTTCLYLHRQL